MCSCRAASPHAHAKSIADVLQLRLVIKPAAIITKESPPSGNRLAPSPEYALRATFGSKATKAWGRNTCASC